MSLKANFIYREFYDVPRMFVVQHKGLQFLFESKFDEAADGYSEEYQVYLVSNISNTVLSGSWDKLPGQATKRLGKVQVKQVKFDSTKRKEVDTTILDDLIKQMEL